MRSELVGALQAHSRSLLIVADEYDTSGLKRASNLFHGLRGASQRAMGALQALYGGDMHAGTVRQHPRGPA